MNNDRLYRFLWLDQWQLEEQEAWFSDMLAQGWMLKTIRGFYARFERCEPQDSRFCCDVFHRDETAGKERIASYKEAGWEHITSRGIVQIFRSPLGSTDSELCTELEAYAKRISVLRTQVNIKGMVVLLLSVFIVSTQLLTAGLFGANMYLKDSFSFPMMAALGYGYICWTLLQGMIHLHVIIKRLNQGQSLRHKLQYRSALHTKKWFGGSVIALLLLWLCTSMVSLHQDMTTNYFAAIPLGKLPVVRLADIETAGSIQSSDGYYRTHSSLTVPEQYQIQESAKLAGMKWTDGSGVYNPFIQSEGYLARNPLLAKGLAQTLVAKPGLLSLQMTEKDYWHRVSTPRGLDALWQYDEKTSHEFVALKGNHVYHVVYNGMVPIERVVGIVSTRTIEMPERK